MNLSLYETKGIVVLYVELAIENGEIVNILR